MGSEILARTLWKSSLALSSEDFLRPRQKPIATVRRIPVRMPGKKPARTALVGYLSQLLLQAAGNVELPFDPLLGEADAEADEEDADDDAEEPVAEGEADEGADDGAEDGEAEPWSTHSSLLQS